MDKNENLMQFENNLFFYERGNEVFVIRTWVYWQGLNPVFYSEKKDNTEEIVMTFEKMTYGLWNYIENNILDKYHGANDMDVAIYYNFYKLRVFIIKWLLRSWSLPIDLKRKSNGELENVCFEEISKLHPHVMSYFLEKYEESLFISSSERDVIAKQCAQLFMPNSKGVSNAHDAISLYCNLASMWEKFGINYFDIQKLPQDVFLKLKMVTGFESDFKHREIQKSNNNLKNSGSKIPKRGFK